MLAKRKASAWRLAVEGARAAGVGSLTQKQLLRWACAGPRV